MLRSKGVIKYIRSKDSLELLLGPVAAKIVKEDRDPRAAKRSHYMNLLGRSSMSDAELDLLPDAT